MCMVLYLAATTEPKLVPFDKDNPHLSVDALAEHGERVRNHFSLPYSMYVGARGCGCDFNMAQATFDEKRQFAGWVSQERTSSDEEAEEASRTELLALLRELTAAGPVELYPCWDGDEEEPPRRSDAARLADLEADWSLLKESVLLRLTA